MKCFQINGYRTSGAASNGHLVPLTSCCMAGNHQIHVGLSVYQRKPRNFMDLMRFIEDMNRQRKLCHDICQSVDSRCQEYIEADGLKFEPYR